MNVRDLIIETLLKEATEDEKLAADLLGGVFDEIASDIKANKNALVPQQQNEAVGLAILGGVVAAPAIMKIIGKGVKLGQNALRKRKGEEPLDSNAIIEMAEKLHHIYISGIEKALFFIKDKDKKHRLAVIIFHAVVAGLLIASGKGFFKALAKHQSIAAFIEAMLTAIKTGELGVFASETFGALASALGTATELSDAIELTDADLLETSTMGAGAVEGTACGLGKKADIYDTWNQNSLEETNMNKIKITKGRLRKIIAEEVSRHNQTKLNEMGVEEEEAEAAETAAETDAAEYMGQTDEAQLREVSPVSKPRDMNHLRKQIKETLEEMLSDDPIEEAYQGTKSKPTKQAWGKPTKSEKKVEKEKDRKAGKKQAKINEADVNWTKNDLLKHLSNNNSVSAADLKYAFKGSSQANSAALAKLADEGVLEKTGKRYKLASKDK